MIIIVVSAHIIVQKIVVYSRKGAKAARNFNVSFVLIPSVFAYFVPRLDPMIVSLAEAQSPQRI